MPSDDVAILYQRLLAIVQRTRQTLHADDFANLPALLAEQASLLQTLQQVALSPDPALVAMIETIDAVIQATMHEAEQDQQAIQEQLRSLGARKKPFTAYLQAQSR